MSDYIKREDAKQTFCDNCRKTTYDKCEYKDTCASIRVLNRLPSADVVAVVRCKDCKYCEEYETMYGMEYYCNRVWCSPYDWGAEPKFYVALDDYCSHGERADMRGVE